MKALLWKDWHVNRPVLLAAAVIAAVPYAVVCVAGIVSRARYHVTRPWHEWLSDACLASMMLSCVSISLLGGYVLAGERSERSAEFLACLPVARRRILGSKLATVIGWTAALWLVEGLLAALAAAAGTPLSARSLADGLLVLTAACALSLGAAWLGGACTGSPAIGTAAGLAAPFLLLLALTAAGSGPGNPLGPRTFVLLAGGLGLAMLGGGSWLFVRRVEG